LLKTPGPSVSSSKMRNPIFQGNSKHFKV
jgi:hypothetical protein